MHVAQRIEGVAVVERAGKAHDAPLHSRFNLEAIILDIGIGEQLLAHLFRGFLARGVRRRIDIEHDVAADVHTGDTGESRDS